MMRRVQCPVCHGAMDALLAPAPVIRDGRVILCCCADCAERLRRGEIAPASALEPAEPDGAARPSRAAGARGAASAVDRPPRLRRLSTMALLGASGLAVVTVGVYLLLAHGRAGAHSPNAADQRLAPMVRVGTRAVQPPRREPRPRTARPRDPPTDGSRSVLSLRRRSWRVLESFLASRVVRFRLTAADVLAEQKDQAAIGTLRRALSDEIWTTRRLAAEALARLGHAEGIATLKTGLKAKRRPIQWASAFALARCGDPSGETLLKQLAYFRKHRLTSYEALAHLGDASSLKYLRRVLRTSPAPDNRLRAAVALGLAGDRSGLPVLRKRLHDPGLHFEVALALQKLGVPAAQAALRRALNHHALRVEAARALRAYGAISDVDRMVPDLTSAEPEAQVTAAGAIVILTTQSRAEAP